MEEVGDEDAFLGEFVEFLGGGGVDFEFEGEFVFGVLLANIFFCLSHE